jgi:hypothetical protein
MLVRMSTQKNTQQDCIANECECKATHKNYDFPMPKYLMLPEKEEKNECRNTMEYEASNKRRKHFLCRGNAEETQGLNCDSTQSDKHDEPTSDSPPKPFQIEALPANVDLMRFSLVYVQENGH